jgi:hypothetical protein
MKRSNKPPGKPGRFIGIGLQDTGAVLQMLAGMFALSIR